MELRKSYIEQVSGRQNDRRRRIRHQQSNKSTSRDQLREGPGENVFLFAFIGQVRREKEETEGTDGAHDIHRLLSEAAPVPNGSMKRRS